MGMVAAGEGKIRHSIQFEQVRAGHLEEIRQRFIRHPLIHQRREIVEDIKHPGATCFDKSMHLPGKSVETGSGI